MVATRFSEPVILGLLWVKMKN